MDWQSSVMRCNVDDSHCPLCRVSGDIEHASDADLRQAVRALDRALGECQKWERKLAVMLADMLASEPEKPTSAAQRRADDADTD